MKKDISLYAFSTAINKGSVLLFFPFLTQLFSLEDFGKWSLAIIVSNLLIPMIALNGSAGILREGSENKNTGFRLLHFFSLIAVTIGLISFFGAKAISLDEWLIYAIAIASAEAILLLTLTFIRTHEKSTLYFLINFFKTLALLGLVLYAKELKFSLSLLLLYHFFVVAFFAGVVLAFQYRHYVTVRIDFKPILFFSIILIPHGISQWIMSSSDRLILEYMLGSESVGIYSLAYNIALVLILLNSGIAMALPTYMIKNYQNWKTQGFDNKFIGYYTYLSILLLMVVMCLYALDFNYFGILGYYGDEMLPLIAIIYFSIYLLGLYYFFANYLFYHKKAAIISKTTFIAALFNIVVTTCFIYWLGVIGAAVGTLAAYIYYLVVIRYEALKFESMIQITLVKPISTFVIALSVVYWGAYNVL
ncbi:MAG: polysaccharide biosynthesis C-terminal domain-containing protein [Aureibaculum sp.]|nr:polysaccharide biosynthesis C-terminal domain-containing protein [Aureibaculum sp.]